MKELTFLWAYQRGYRCCAMEVQAPRSSFRVDVAGIRIDRQPPLSTVAVFECKQSRSDFIRNNRRGDELRTKLLRLQDRRSKLETLLAVHFPSLRTSDCLFPEWASFDFSTLNHRGYRQTIDGIERVQRQLFQNIKFDLVTHYRLGNLHYLVTPVGIVDPREVPIGWGFLEVDSAGAFGQKALPTRFGRIGAAEWLMRIGRASTAQALRSMLSGEHPSKFLPK